MFAPSASSSGVTYHCRVEPRYILYGRGLESRVLMVGFTLRAKRVRVITARPASRRERRIYEKRS